MATTNADESDTNSADMYTEREYDMHVWAGVAGAAQDKRAWQHGCQDAACPRNLHPTGRQAVTLQYMPT